MKETGEDVMDACTMFFALIVMLYPARLMKRMRDNLLYPNGMANRTLVYIVGIVCTIIIQGLMFMWHLELPECFSGRDVVSTCYICVLLNVAAQVLIYKKEDRETSNSRYDYFKWIWLAGVALYSGVFIMALWNQENASLWLLGAGMLHTLYNLAYFFFLYFAEKEIIRTKFESENVRYDTMQNVKTDMPSNRAFDMMPYADSDIKPYLDSDVISHVMPERELPPLHRMYGEEYRKLRFEEVHIRNVVALTMFCMSEIPFMILVVFMLWEGDVPVMAQMTVLCICLFFAGVGYLVYRWKTEEKKIKSMKIGEVYEGIAQVVACPLTVQYMMPEGNLVVQQFLSKDENRFPKGSFVKILVKDGVVEKIVNENGTFYDFYQDIYRFNEPMERGQKLDKEMVRMLKVFLAIAAIGIACFMYFLYDIFM